MIVAAGAILALVIALAPVGASARQAGASNTEKLDISAFAVSMGTIGTGANAVVDITIRRWSTPEERQTLINAMLEKGPDELLKALQKLPVHGKFRIPGLMGPRLRKLSDDVGEC
jgi:hypothetical protein